MRARSPIIFGILNVTPDSFSDGGQFVDAWRAVCHAQQLQKEGADVIDVGGESTRPGAKIIDVKTELARVLPVVKALKKRNISVSLDSRHAAVIETCLPYIAWVNDVEGLRDPAIRRLVARGKKRAIVMHARDVPVQPEKVYKYKNVVTDLVGFFETRIAECHAAGIPNSRLILDPGIGFGKSLADNLKLVANLDAFAALGCEVMLAASRKSFIGKLDNSAVGNRLGGSLAAVLAGYEMGVRMFRVHDVAATRQALTITEVIRKAHTKRNR